MKEKDVRNADEVTVIVGVEVAAIADLQEEYVADLLEEEVVPDHSPSAGKFFSSFLYEIYPHILRVEFEMVLLIGRGRDRFREV